MMMWKCVQLKYIVQIALHIITRAQERYVNNSSNWNVILCIHVSIYLLPSVFLSGYAQTFVSFFRFSLQLDFWLFHTCKLKYVLLTYIVLPVIEEYYKYIPIHYKNLGKFHPNTKNLLFLSLKKFTSGVSSKSGG